MNAHRKQVVLGVLAPALFGKTTLAKRWPGVVVDADAVYGHARQLNPTWGRHAVEAFRDLDFKALEQLEALAFERHLHEIVHPSLPAILIVAHGRHVFPRVATADLVAASDITTSLWTSRLTTRLALLDKTMGPRHAAAFAAMAATGLKKHRDFLARHKDRPRDVPLTDPIDMANRLWGPGSPGLAAFVNACYATYPRPQSESEAQSDAASHSQSTSNKEQN